MKLLQLTINNFLSFETAKLNLADAGLVAVQGKNLDDNGADSNGSGKSSLFLAIRWCLFGTMEKAIAADEVVNSKHGKNCYVETIWQDGDILYRITRYRKHSKHKNKLTLEIKHPGHDWQWETKGKNDLTQVEINNAIGMDDTVFIASCFAGQEDPIDIPSMKDAELKKLLETSLPLAKFDPLHQKYKAKHEELLKEYRTLTSNRTSVDHSLTVNSELLDKTLAEKKRFTDEREGMKDTAKAKIDKLTYMRDMLIEQLPDVARLNAIKTALEARYAATGIAEASTISLRLQNAYRRQMDLDAKDPSRCPTCGNEWEAGPALWEHMDKVGALGLEINGLTNELRKAKEKAPEAERIQKAISETIGKIEKYTSEKMMIEKYNVSIASETTILRSLEGDPFDGSITMLKENMSKDNARLNGIDRRLDEIMPSMTLFANLVEASSPTGFRYHMLESITPELNRQTNYYLSLLTDGKIGATWSTVKRLGSGEFKEAFSITVNMNGRTSFGALSGGQKKKVRLACWFALQDLIADRAAKDIKLWVCDEVDGALDKAGIERLMSLLQEKARTKETVLVISHNSMKDWIANSITVSMEDDVSKVSGFLNVI